MEDDSDCQCLRVLQTLTDDPICHLPFSHEVTYAAVTKWLQTEIHKQPNRAFTGTQAWAGLSTYGVREAVRDMANQHGYCFRFVDSVAYELLPVPCFLMHKPVIQTLDVLKEQPDVKTFDLAKVNLRYIMNADERPGSQLKEDDEIAISQLMKAIEHSTLTFTRLSFQLSSPPLATEWKEWLHTKYPMALHDLNKETEYASDDVTVVTAYYNIASKFPNSTYLTWIASFLKVPCKMVIVTTDEERKRLEPLRPASMKDRTRFIICNDVNDWEVMHDVPGGMAFWEQTMQQDVELKQYNHSPLLYALWNQKPYWLNQVGQTNPFQTKWFCWVDIGCVRTDFHVDAIWTFPSASLLKPAKVRDEDRLLLMEIKALSNSDRDMHPKLGLPKIICNPEPNKSCGVVVRVQGGFFGGTVVACRTWLEHYRTVLNQFVKTNTFAGKDQNIMTATAIMHPQIVRFHPVTEWLQFLTDFASI